ncbi:MAG: ABC transporter ATP-binding protein [Lachnospiraceae bacterium]|nr:ABC transporter ATP-binding protein [Lachnospiraceae bacterium]
MIELKDVCKSYKGSTYQTNVIKNVCIKINDGDFVGLVGKSGCGKSTLLNIIGCIDSMDSGEYYLDDICVNSLSRKQKDKLRKEKIAFIFQNYELMEGYTVRENIEMPMNVRGISRNEKSRRIIDIAKRLGINGILDKYPKEISGGEQQRVAIARAYTMDCKYILADEPTGALDDKNTREILSIMKELNKEGKTIIMVSHDKEVVGECDYILELIDGTV